MSINTLSAKNVLESLFKQAQTESGIDYIYTLLRLTGITCELDPLLQISESIKKIGRDVSDIDFIKEYRLIIELKDPLHIIVNLLNCASKDPYDANPFFPLNKGEFPNIVEPNISQCLKYVLDRCEKENHKELSNILQGAFPEQLFNLINNNEKALSEVTYLKAIFNNTKEFLNAMIDIQKEERLKYLKQSKLYKLPRFEVLELLTQPDVGLYGFKIHFSNGNFSEFTRKNDETSCSNILPGTPIDFFVGSLDELRHEWRIGDQRLFEIGLPGRYNKLGEWKPIVYPANSDILDILQKESESYSDDPRIHGSIFYMLCTGHQIVEFVICTTLDLPNNYATMGNKIHLWKCPSLNEEQSFYQNIRIYDGWIKLDSADFKQVSIAIDTINIFVNRLAFIYGASVKWRVKYNMLISEGGCQSPKDSDLKIFNDSIERFPIGEDTMILDSAIDWFNHGKYSSNIFTRFLCYYIAIELIVLKIADSKADFGLGYSKHAKDKKEKETCIEAKYQKLYQDDPIKFIKETYFDCIVSIKSKTRQVINLIFGENHEYLKKLFDKEDGWSLSDIRGELAHGEFSYLDENHQKIVAKRICDIENIARELIFRLNFRLKPEETTPCWSNLHKVSHSFADPRLTLVVSRKEDILNKDWRIRPEWCN